MNEAVLRETFNSKDEQEELEVLRYLWWRIVCYVSKDTPDGYQIGHDGYKGIWDVIEWYKVKAKDKGIELQGLPYNI